MVERFNIVRIEGEKLAVKAARPGNRNRTAMNSRDRWLSRTLSNINYRCTNPKDRHYSAYGERGIQNFLNMEDLQFLYERDRPDLLLNPSIDRLETNGNYERGNCAFIEFVVNSKKRRTRFCTRCGDPRPPVSTNRNQRCENCVGYRNCRACKKEVNLAPGQQLCQECRFTTKPCSLCGRPVTVDRGLQHGRLKNEHWFCNRKEFFKWQRANPPHQVRQSLHAKPATEAL